MANQCRQLGDLLESVGVQVRRVRTNAPYRPAWLGRIQCARAPARLLPFLVDLWRACGAADVVHIFANSGWMWHLVAAPAIRFARLRGVPVIVNYRGGGAAEFFAKAPSWVKRSAASANALIVPSGYLREVFAGFGLSAQIIPNIIDVERFKPRNEARRERGPHIVVTRNLEPIYDIATAIRAFAIVRRAHPTARMTIAGKGPELASLRALCDSLHVTDAVTFAGAIDNQAVAALYDSADLFLNTSLVDNMPISVLEAFASGVPVVSTNVGGIPYIAENGRTALLVPPGQPEACATAMQKLLDDASLAQALTSAGLEESRRYSWRAVSTLWLEEYVRHAHCK
jgi:glycosyltransferase involved in cell wall biosynthesis